MSPILSKLCFFSGFDYRLILVFFLNLICHVFFFWLICCGSHWVPIPQVTPLHYGSFTFLYQLQNCCNLLKTLVKVFEIGVDTQLSVLQH